MSKNTENSQNVLSKEATEVVVRLRDKYDRLIDFQIGPVGSCPQADTLQEMLTIENPGPTDDDIFAKMLSRKARKDQVEASGGPSRQWGSDAATLPCPPLDNMGVTKYHKTKMEHPQTCTTDGRNPHMGGYDGGAEIGFDGEWNTAALNALKGLLEPAKAAAAEKDGEPVYVTLGDRICKIMPHGGGKKVHYNYILESEGVKIYIHNNPKKNIQPIRVRYAFEALIGNSLFAVHKATLDWFEQIGFTVKDEKISRLDLQVMTERPVREYIELIILGHAIQRAKKDDIRRENNKFQTFTAGTNIQICIYDKQQELIGNEIKTQLMAKYCCGLDLPERCSNGARFIWDNLTRIEFRLKREALKCLDINTISDLKEKELSLVAYLTEVWFRILESPKVRGHENKQTIHPLWKEVQELFRFHFPGNTENRSEVKRGKTNIIKCTGEALLKQGMGCLSTMIALCKGAGCNISEALNFVIEKISEPGNLIKLTERANARAIELGIVRAVSPKDFDPHTTLDFQREQTLRDSWGSWARGMQPAKDL